MFDEEIISAATKLVNKAVGLGLWVTTAESCTGGLIAGALTSISGASNCVGAGYVTYSNEAKEQALTVSVENLNKFGAVSQEVALDMAAGALNVSNADLALAVTGIAGPGGGSLEKPVGLVYIAAVGGTNRQFSKVLRHEFGDIGRTAVRRETVLQALALGLEALEQTN